MNKPELLSKSEMLMISPLYDLKTFFQPEHEFQKGGIEGLNSSGLLRSLQAKSELIEIHGQVAVLTIEGPMRPGRDWYYSVGYGDIQDAITELKENESIRTVILKIDTPGGTVKGAFETHKMLQELAEEKTLIALITGSATSAGALLTFPASQRWLASVTAQTGSIGVVAEHIDNRIWYREMWGEIRTSVAAGTFKDAGTDTREFDEKAKLVFESAVSKLHNIFVTTAAEGLEKTYDFIDSQQSLVFTGDDGIEQGFADGFKSLDELIAESKASSFFSTPGRPAFSTHSTEFKTMDINQLKAEHQDVYNSVLALGKAEGSPALKETHTAEGKAAGILMERKRINDIDALGLPAEQAKAGKESDFSAEKVSFNFLKEKAEKEGADLEAKKTEIDGDLQKSLDSDAPTIVKEPEGGAKNTVAEYEAAVLAAQQGGKVTKGEAMKFVKLNQPDLHTAFINHSNGKGE